MNTSTLKASAESNDIYLEYRFGDSSVVIDKVVLLAVLQQAEGSQFQLPVPYASFPRGKNNYEVLYD
jgi:hypothetical protein